MNQPAAKVVEPGGGELAQARGGEDGAGAAERGIVEIDGAAGIAEVGIAAGLEQPALGLLQIVGEAAHLGGEGGAGAADLAEGAGAHQHALAVSAQLTRQISMAASSKRPAARSSSLRRSDFRAEETSRLSTERPSGVLDLAGGEAGGGLEGGAVEDEVAVVVGEAEGGAVVARHAPAPGERGGAGVEVGLEGWGEEFHGVWRSRSDVPPPVREGSAKAVSQSE